MQSASVLLVTLGFILIFLAQADGDDDGKHRTSSSTTLSLSTAPVTSTSTQVSTESFDNDSLTTLQTETRRSAAAVTRLRALVSVALLVAGLGVCGNLLVLVIWSGRHAFNPTVFFMKCLAVTDIVLLVDILAEILRRLLSDTAVKNEWFFMVVMFYCRTFVAHTTLAVVFTRWLAVYKPFKVDSLLTKRRVVQAYVIMLVWCLTSLPVFFLLKMKASMTFLTTLNVVETVYLALPVVCMVVLNVSLVHKFLRHRAEFNPNLQQQETTRATRTSERWRLLAAVVCVSVTSVVVYPVGVVARVSLNLSRPSGVRLMILVLGLTEMVNSSINVLYYCIFLSQFRQLCRRRLDNCLALCGKTDSSHSVETEETETVQ